MATESQLREAERKLGESKEAIRAAVGRAEMAEEQREATVRGRKERDDSALQAARGLAREMAFRAAAERELLQMRELHAEAGRVAEVARQARREAEVAVERETAARVEAERRKGLRPGRCSAP